MKRKFAWGRVFFGLAFVVLFPVGLALGMLSLHSIQQFLSEGQTTIDSPVLFSAGGVVVVTALLSLLAYMNYVKSSHDNDDAQRNELNQDRS